MPLLNWAASCKPVGDSTATAPPLRHSPCSVLAMLSGNSRAAPPRALAATPGCLTSAAIRSGDGGSEHRGLGAAVTILTAFAWRLIGASEPSSFFRDRSAGASSCKLDVPDAIKGRIVNNTATGSALPGRMDSITASGFAPFNSPSPCVSSSQAAILA
eukprot:scaffold13717_cov132-Isochrysis_galbana.AAC.6